jgi:hypothetical protein
MAVRFLALLLVAFAALPLSAATFRAVPEGVPLQLSLPFAAMPVVVMANAPVAPMLSASALPTVMAPAAAAPVAVIASPVAVLARPSAAPVIAAPSAATWGNMPPAVAKAFRAGDAREFWEACRLSGFEPPPSDDAQQSLLAEGWARVTADEAYVRSWIPAEPLAAPAPAARAKSTKMDYEVFGAELSRRGTPDSAVFSQTETKRSMLRNAGYTHLYGQGGARISIDDASPARIGLAFAETLKAWRRRAAR